MKHCSKQSALTSWAQVCYLPCVLQEPVLVQTEAWLSALKGQRLLALLHTHQPVCKSS